MKEYETYDNVGINFQAVILIVLIIVVSVFYLSPYIFKPEVKPIPVVKCESYAIQIEYVTVIVTPTPDGKLYYASEYNEGIRKIQNPFSFYSNNASGYKKMLVRSFVYDYKILPYLTWHNDNDNMDYRLHPKVGNKFLFVCFAMYLDDRVADDTSYYIPSSQNFVVSSLSDNKVMYYPFDYPHHLKIVDLENTLNFNGDSTIEYFGEKMYYTRSIDNRKTAGYTSVPQEVLRGGKSNAASGYVLYEIPTTLKEDDIIAGINFGAFGTSWWRLKP